MLLRTSYFTKLCQLYLPCKKAVPYVVTKSQSKMLLMVFHYGKDHCRSKDYVQVFLLQCKLPSYPLKSPKKSILLFINKSTIFVNKSNSVLQL